MIPYLDRLDAAASRYRSSNVPDGGRPLPMIRSIAFDSVSFGYRRERPVLFDVSFTVQAGESIGIVGRAGTGKSTVVQLLLRLHDANAGTYLVNGEAASTFADGMAAPSRLRLPGTTDFPWIGSRQYPIFPGA